MMPGTGKDAPYRQLSIHSPGASWETVKRAREQRRRTVKNKGELTQKPGGAK